MKLVELLTNEKYRRYSLNELEQFISTKLNLVEIHLISGSDFTQKAISVKTYFNQFLKTENELGVSDVARGEHGDLHAVGKCNASGQDTAEPSATDVDGALGEIIDTENDLYQCQTWLNHASWCKEYCGNCRMGGKS